MLTVSFTDGRVVLGNLLGDVPTLQIATWLLQILPLFFFAGAAASTYGWHAAPEGKRNAGHWLFARTQRLLRPVFWYLAVVMAIVGVLGALGNTAVLDVVEHLGVQLLWFLGAYLMILAIVPLVQLIDDGPKLLVAVLACYAATAIADLMRLTTGVEAWGYPNYLSVWMIPALMGVGYAKRLIRPTVALVLAVAMLSVNVALVGVGPYEVSLVTVPGQQLSNMTPPSLLLAGHTIVLCAFAIAAARGLARLVARPRIWWWVVLGNRGAMTLYLWHLPTLALIVATGMGLGYERTPDAPDYGWIVAGQTVLLLLAMVPVVAGLSFFENRALPWWDSSRARMSEPMRDRTVWGLLVVTGLSILMFARSGLVGAGWWWLAIGVAGAVGARLVTARGPIMQMN